MLRLSTLRKVRRSLFLQVIRYKLCYLVFLIAVDVIDRYEICLTEIITNASNNIITLINYDLI